MFLSLRWLKQYLPNDLTLDALAQTITMAGHEVENLLDLGEGSGKIQVARILEAAPHPDADKLRVCKVDVGEEAPLDVVCGAPNARAGLTVVCARVGAELPEGMTIKKAKIRGQKSEGMLCASDELGLGGDHSGILELPDTFKVGEPFDAILDIKVTPNRPDCLSVFGMARDIGAMIGKQVHPPTPRFKEMLEHIESFVNLSVSDRQGCSRYACRLIRGVKIGPSPDWLKVALIASGLRPINNVVDVTNYVLMELGHPLHAFDFKTLKGEQVQVRRAGEGEKLTIIDGSELTLCAEDLVIADGERAVALAGVMGGKDTEVCDTTSWVLLESAYFDPASIRKTAKRYGLQTDASYRFERGADRKRLLLALNRATQLIQELAGGEVIKGVLDQQAPVPEREPILLEINRVNQLLGVHLSSTEIADYLVNLDFEIRRSEKDTLVVTVPSHRVDVVRDVDLIEEVARLYSYDKIPSTMPEMIAARCPRSEMDQLIEQCQDAMTSIGFDEALNYSFISDQQVGWLGYDPQAQPRMANPLTAEQAVMRPSLLPGLLISAAHNQKVDEPSIALFEVGKVWKPGAQAGDVTGERRELAALLAGPTPQHWASKARVADFYDLKGAVEALFASLSRRGLDFEPLTDSPVLHPGRSARILWMGQPVGELGELHPDQAAWYDLRGRLYVVRIDLDAVLGKLQAADTALRPIPRFPGSERDLALVVKTEVAAGALMAAVRKAGGALVESVALFDVYEGEHVEAGYKSLALRVKLRAPERTLTEEDIAPTMEAMVKAVGKQFDAQLRG